ncbi:hypothetical protein H6P81_012101 [Aristolochia fimbriata]|uniref:FCP1 homology domain-containing protein n=1 Tax=Aristolochia fimbriata TaxID=158543 RepID=A0AAV7EAZ6_ARIFI|nr:hypothetical protein H6P81_012101 [Aristolochia fimbriata]
MQTRRKVLSRNGSCELVSSRCRQQKKALDHAQVTEEKVTDLITSSARKQRFAGAVPRKGRDFKLLKKPTPNNILVENEARDMGSGCDTIDEVSIDHQDCEMRATECELETLFSPVYHISKHLDEDISTGDILTCEDRMITEGPEGCGDVNMGSCVLSPKESSLLNCNEEKVGDTLSSEVSAIYLAMQQSKLEYMEDPSDDSISEVCVEADEGDDLDDFDPYLFIKNLPDLSTVVPTFRPMLLPKQTRSCPRTTLVLDLDETLVHSSLEHCENADFTFQVNFNLMEHTVYVRCRPYLKDFMERVASLFEIIVFTASQSIYAEQLLNVLDPKRRLFRHRVFRESCVFVEGNYLKDLSVLGRDLARVVIVDNSPQAFGFQVDNGIPIQSWFNDPTDRALEELLPFLESLVGVDDVRPILAKKFNLREKVAAAVGPSVRYQ